jgi:hypothetical protein
MLRAADTSMCFCRDWQPQPYSGTHREKQASTMLTDSASEACEVLTADGGPTLPVPLESGAIWTTVPVGCMPVRGS